MTGSGSPRMPARGWVSILAVLGVMTGTPANVFAQDETAPAAPPPAEPLSLVPGAPSPEASPNSPPPSFGPSGISVQSLDSISTDTVGLLASDVGGFPVTMWDGSSRKAVETLLPRLPDRVRSPAMRDLTTRLLLTAAVVPPPDDVKPAFDRSPGDEDVAQDFLEDTPEGTILLTRMAQLSEMGDWQSVRTLFNQIPMDERSSRLRQIKTDADLVDGYVEAACADAEMAVTNDTAAYWQKVLVFCQLRKGEVDEASFGMALLQELGAAEPAFVWAAELMAGNRPLTPSNLERLTPLQLAMLRDANYPVPPDLVNAGDPTLLRVLALKALPDRTAPGQVPEEAMLENLPSEEDASDNSTSLDALSPPQDDPWTTAWTNRVTLAERAMAVGSVTADELRGLYDLVDPATEEEQSVALEDRRAATPRDRALLYKLAKSQFIPTARAEVVAHVIDRATRRGASPDIFAVAPVYADMVRNMPVSPELLWFAGHASRIMMAVNDRDGAEEWLMLVRTFARTSSDGELLEQELWPYMRLVGLDGPMRWTDRTFTAWQDLRGPSVQTDTTLLMILLSSVGDNVRAEDWLPLLDDPVGSRAAIPAPADWFALGLAARNSRLAETVTLAALVMTGDLPSFVSPQTLEHVARALTGAGLAREARQLAVEAALARGF